MPDDNMTIIAVVSIVGVVALVGLVLFAFSRSSSPTGSVAVVDDQGNLLYQISDQPRRVIGTVPFQPAAGP